MENNHKILLTKTVKIDKSRCVIKKLKKISTHLLTVLIIGVIVQLEQEGRA